jgi:hypothetical protein
MKVRPGGVRMSRAALGLVLALVVVTPGAVALSAGAAAVVGAAAPALSWTMSVPPLPSTPASSAGTLNGVACTGGGTCIAVGSYGAAYGLIDTFSGGTWTPIEAPFPPGLGSANGYSDQLNAVTCPAPGECVAVGDAETNSYPISDVGVIDQLSGGTWNTQAIGSSSLSSVSCAGPTFCVANGGELNLDLFSGGTWTPTVASLPPGGSNGEILAVSCGAVGSCVAVGGYRLSAGVGGGLIDSYSDGTWSATEAPETSATKDALSSLTSVSCVSAESCTAVGAILGSGTNCDVDPCNSASLAETLTSGSWVPYESHLNDANLHGSGDPSAEPGLQSVSCWGPGDCSAVGGMEGSQTALLESSKNGVWKNSAVYLPGGSVTLPAARPGLTSVACGTANFCVGLGAYIGTKAPTYARVVLAVFNGTTWSKTVPDLPSGIENPNEFLYANGVSCSGSGPGSCAAVGGFYTPPFVVTD